MNTISVDTCKDFARSLISNVSLQSGQILVPSILDLEKVCRHVQQLWDEGINLRNERVVRQLIHGGNKKIEASRGYQNLLTTLGHIERKVLKEQYGGRIYYPVMSPTFQSAGAAEPPYFPQIGGNIMANDRIYFSK